MDDLEAFIFGGSCELINLWVIDKGLTTASKVFGISSVHMLFIEGLHGWGNDIHIHNIYVAFPCTNLLQQRKQ